jgi:hypothetical protein
LGDEAEADGLLAVGVLPEGEDERAAGRGVVGLVTGELLGEAKKAG